MTAKYCSDCKVKFGKGFAETAYPWGDKLLCPACFKKAQNEFGKLPEKERKAIVENAKLKIIELRKEKNFLMLILAFIAIAIAVGICWLVSLVVK
jgi:hypothetical protein